MTKQNEIITILSQGDMEVEGRFIWGSNSTLLANVSKNGETIPAVYKPTQGERPLWDFPVETLALREVAAYLVSEALGWSLIPPTVFREDGPFGAGSLQLFIEHDPDYHFFNFTEEDRQQLHQVAIFDLIVNNADRKGGHFLFDPDQRLWVIDHGVCFHVEAKLRTVLWDYAGEALPQELCEDINDFHKELVADTAFLDRLSRYLTRREITAMTHRTERVLLSEKFPFPPNNQRPYPWPLV